MAAARQTFTLEELYASEESTKPDAPLEGLTITDTNHEWVAGTLPLLPSPHTLPPPSPHPPSPIPSLDPHIKNKRSKNYFVFSPSFLFLLLFPLPFPLPFLFSLSLSPTDWKHCEDSLLEDMSRVAASEAEAWEACKGKDGCVVEQDKSGQLAITRGRYAYEYPASIMFQVFRTHDHLRVCDSRYKSSQVLETFSSRSYISQMLYKFPMPLKDRAMVTFATEQVGGPDNGWEYIVCSSSAAHSAPIPKKHVRLFLQRSGYVIHALNADGSRVSSAEEAQASTRCAVTWIAQVDPRGKVPKRVSNMQSSAAFILLTVRTWLDRDSDVLAAYTKLASQSQSP